LIRSLERRDVMKKSLLALLVAVAVVAPVAEATFFGKSFTLAPNSAWKLDVVPSAGNGSGTAVTVLAVRGATLGVLDNLTVSNGGSISRSYRAPAKGVDRIIITFDQPNQTSTTLVRITQDDPPNKFELPVLGDHGQWVIDVVDLK
jgi:hypothetical protein